MPIDAVRDPILRPLTRNQPAATHSRDPTDSFGGNIPLSACALNMSEAIFRLWVPRGEYPLVVR